MATNPPGSKIAEQLLTRPEGATMDEIVAATGSPQYNLLKRLEGRGYAVRKVRKGHSTRYFAVPPLARSHEATVTAKGQITIPAEIRERLGVGVGDTLRFETDAEGRVTLAPAKLSIRRMFGMLGKPRRSLTLEEIDDVIADAAVERFRRAKG
jgi:AbrB family looped-hinge helix DNA binding protein